MKLDLPEIQILSDALHASIPELAPHFLGGSNGPSLLLLEWECGAAHLHVSVELGWFTEHAGITPSIGWKNFESIDAAIARGAAEVVTVGADLVAENDVALPLRFSHDDLRVAARQVVARLLVQKEKLACFWQDDGREKILSLGGKREVWEFRPQQ